MDDVEASAVDWLHRYRAAGFKVQVDALTMRPHPDSNAVDACRDMWAELRNENGLELRTAVERQIRTAVESLSSWTDWPVRG